MNLWHALSDIRYQVPIDRTLQRELYEYPWLWNDQTMGRTTPMWNCFFWFRLGVFISMLILWDQPSASNGATKKWCIYRIWIHGPMYGGSMKWAPICIVLNLSLSWSLLCTLEYECIRPKGNLCVRLSDKLLSLLSPTFLSAETQGEARVAAWTRGWLGQRQRLLTWRDKCIFSDRVVLGHVVFSSPTLDDQQWMC